MSKYEKKTLMIIGAGIFQSVAIQQAKKLGLTVLATDIDRQAPGFEYADFTGIVSTQDIQATTEFAVEFNKTQPIHGVMTVGTDVSQTVAGVAHTLGLPGVSPETALCATNKARMRERFWKEGVPAPKWREITTLQQAYDAISELGLPVVLKPIDNMGARGVKKIESKDDLPHALNKALLYSKLKKAVIEEFMDGPELSVDTLVCNGKVHLLTIADRHITGSPFFIETGHTVPSSLPQETLDDVFAVMCKAVKAIGIENGASKADIKVTPDGPKIGEITARLSGGYHSQYTDPLATGMNSIKGAIDLALGYELDLNDVTPARHYTACERAIIPPPGMVTEIKNVEKLNTIQGFNHLFLHVKIGEKIGEVTSNIGKAANIICSAPTRFEAIESVNQALKTLEIITE